jgi:hypothetical protein
MTERKAADAAKAVAAVLQDDPVAGASKQAVRALEDLIDALGNAAEREVATLVLDVVKESGDDMLILKSATAVSPMLPDDEASQVQTNGDLRSWVDPCTNAPPTAH